MLINTITIDNESGSSNPAEDVFDPVFGIRISKPLVTLETVNTFCNGMRKHRLCHLNTVRQQQSQQQQSRNGEEWVTMGVIVEKGVCRKSANGNEFMIWRISDLTDLNATVVKVLLFGDCFRQYWKLQTGNTILLNNPQFGEQQTKDGAQNNEVVLKLTKAGQLIELGFCSDLGRCQGRKMTDGEQCSNFVNKSRSLYCPFHLQQKARKVAADRGTLNRSTNLPTKNWRRKEFNGGREDEEKPPPGIITMNRRHSLEPGKMYTKPISMVQRGLSNNLNSSVTISSDLEKRSEEIDKLISENPYNFGSKNLRIMKLQKENHDPKGQAKKPSLSIANQHSLNSMRDFINSQNNLLAANSSQNVSMKAEFKEQMKIKRAAEILKSSENGVKRPKLGQDDGGSETSQQDTPSRGSLLGGSFTMEQIRALLNKKGSHEEEVAKEELNRQNAYFDRRELEEQVETNSTTLMEIKKCKVITCKECDYTSVHQSTYCKLQGHDVKWHQADKRFFKCQGCQRRTTSYERLPTKPCLGCKSTNFIRVAMKDERKMLLEDEKLKIKEEERNFSTTSGN